MSLSSRVPEYILAESEKTPHMARAQVCTSLNLEVVAAELRLLSREVAISIITLGRIQSSLEVLQVSLEAP